MTEPEVPAGLFDARPPALDPARCLNLRHAGAGCAVCVDRCPVGAIACPDGLPRLDTNVCTACGACVTGCPTDAFSESVPDERRTITACDSVAGQVHLICPLGRPTGAEPATTVRHSRCLGAISVPALVEISQQGRRAVGLDLRSCASCPIGANRLVIEQAVATADALLRGFGALPAISCTYDGPEGVAEVVDSAGGPLTRRGLFRSIARGIKQRSEASAVPPPAQRRVGGPPAARLPQYVPQSHQQLLAQADATAARAASLPETWPADDLPLGRVVVDDSRCSACGLCSHFCPSGALMATQETFRGRATAPRFRLGVSDRYCIACAVCAAACPEDAITFAARVRPPEVVSGAVRLLVDAGLHACPGCGLATRSDPAFADGSCFSCRHGAGTVRPNLDGAGLMSDLWRREQRVDTSFSRPVEG